jgi:hypothetical protein
MTKVPSGAVVCESAQTLSWPLETAAVIPDGSGVLMW